MSRDDSPATLKSFLRGLPPQLFLDEPEPADDEHDEKILREPSFPPKVTQSHIPKWKYFPDVLPNDRRGGGVKNHGLLDFIAQVDALSRQMDDLPSIRETGD